MPGPFDALTPEGGGSPLGFLTDPNSAAAPLLDVFAIGNRTRSAELTHNRQLEEQKMFQQLQTRAAQIASQNPGMDQAHIAMELFKDPVGQQSMQKLPADRIKDLFTQAIPGFRPSPT